MVTQLQGQQKQRVYPELQLWCAFLSSSIQVLEDSGSLSFVLPAAWDYALYATEVRQAVLDRFAV